MVRKEDKSVKKVWAGVTVLLGIIILAEPRVLSVIVALFLIIMGILDLTED